MTLKEMRNKGQLHELFLSTLHPSDGWKFKKLDNTPCWWSYWERSTFKCWWRDYEVIHPSWRGNLATSSKETYKFTLSPRNPMSWNLSQIQCQKYGKDMQKNVHKCKYRYTYYTFSCTTAVEKCPLSRRREKRAGFSLCSPVFHAWPSSANQARHQFARDPESPFWREAGRKAL